jgi:hypothetical protein
MNHKEAYELAGLRRGHSNIAKCYIDLVDFINDDLQIALLSLENILGEIQATGDSFRTTEAEKAISKIKELMEKVE